MPKMTNLTFKEFVALLPDREHNRAAKSKLFTAYFTRAGNFTTVLIECEMGKYIGTSKRSPDDKDTETGLKIAAVRAFKEFTGRDPGYCRQHSVSYKGERFYENIDLLEEAQDFHEAAIRVRASKKPFYSEPDTSKWIW